MSAEYCRDVYLCLSAHLKNYWKKGEYASAGQAGESHRSRHWSRNGIPLETSCRSLLDPIPLGRAGIRCFKNVLGYIDLMKLMMIRRAAVRRMDKRIGLSHIPCRISCK